MADVKGIQELVNGYAQRGEMLPLSRQEVYEDLREFTVAERDDTLAGTCALHICWENLGEIRSLAVHPDFSGQGIGRELVKDKLKEAKGLGLKRIFVLTCQDAFFTSLGFQAIDKSQLPHKVWADCIKCVKFPDCDENAYVYELED
jgi:amino-acid N-acetyltransferase